MDPFSFLVLLTMATFALCGGSILLSFLVMERKVMEREGARVRASGQGAPAAGRRARKRRNRF